VQFSGWQCREGSPVPIPNTVVKPLRADGTTLRAWESRSPPKLSFHIGYDLLQRSKHSFGRGGPKEKPHRSDQAEATWRGNSVGFTRQKVVGHRPNYFMSESSTQAQTGDWGNGSPADSGSASPGSNPGSPTNLAPSSRGLGRRPLTAQTGVRIPMGSPSSSLFSCRRGGTGRRVRLRGVWVTPWGFKSPRRHHVCRCGGIGRRARLRTVSGKHPRWEFESPHLHQRGRKTPPTADVAQ
jgi:hypothetical protein